MMFNFEIRKRDNVHNLYSDVDLILKNVVDIERQTVAYALQKMIKPGSYFDICTIKNCADVCKVVIPQERLNIYSAIHCIHWSEMTKEYCQTIIAFILDDFREILNPVSNENVI